MYDDLWLSNKKKLDVDLKMTRKDYDNLLSAAEYRALNALSEFRIGDLMKPEPPIEFVDHAQVIEIEEIKPIIKLRMRTLTFI